MERGDFEKAAVSTRFALQVMPYRDKKAGGSSGKVEAPPTTGRVIGEEQRR